MVLYSRGEAGAGSQLPPYLAKFRASSEWEDVLPVSACSFTGAPTPRSARSWTSGRHGPFWPLPRGVTGPAFLPLSPPHHQLPRVRSRQGRSQGWHWPPPDRWAPPGSERQLGVGRAPLPQCHRAGASLASCLHGDPHASQRQCRNLSSLQQATPPTPGTRAFPGLRGLESPRLAKS